MIRGQYLNVANVITSKASERPKNLRGEDYNHPTAPTQIGHELYTCDANLNRHSPISTHVVVRFTPMSWTNPFLKIYTYKKISK